jgi:DNA-binding transcriptional LysR family regulator
MDRFQALTAFTKVVETGSFARAAERLEVSVSAVSRHVAELEAHLDSRLLNRTTRRLSLTESGTVFYERCVQLLADLEEAEESASLQTVKPRGTLRLTCAVTFGERHLAPAVADFLLKYPDMRLSVELSDRTVDLVDEGYDAALRIGAVGSQNLVGRKVGQMRMVCYASPAYLRRSGTPQHPDDLARHTCLSYEYAAQRNVWPFRRRAAGSRDSGSGAGDRSEVLAIRIAGPVQANSGHFLTALAVAGVGIAYEPDFIVGPELRAGRVVRLLSEYQPPPAPIYVVYPSRRHLSAKVRAFADFISDRFATHGWEVDATPPAGKRAGSTHVGDRRNGKPPQR